MSEVKRGEIKHDWAEFTRDSRRQDPAVDLSAVIWWDGTCACEKGQVINGLNDRPLKTQKNKLK
jgi:hypothetical protein